MIVVLVVMALKPSAYLSLCPELVSKLCKGRNMVCALLCFKHFMCHTFMCSAVDTYIKDVKALGYARNLAERRQRGRLHCQVSYGHLLCRIGSQPPGVLGAVWGQGC